MIHQVIRATISNFSMLNGFAYRMGDMFGYGAWPRTDESKVENFFDLELPVLGHDSTVCSHDGGYNKWDGPSGYLQKLSIGSAAGSTPRSR